MYFVTIYLSRLFYFILVTKYNLKNVLLLSTKYIWAVGLTFENVTKYQLQKIVICFLALLFLAIIGRCRLHVMAPGSNSANKNSSFSNM